MSKQSDAISVGPDAFAAEAVRLALVKMFRPDGWFDICTIDKCIQISGVVVPRAQYEPLHALHCVHWRDMSAAMREEVLARTLALFQGARFDLPAELTESLMPDEPAPTTKALSEEAGARRFFSLFPGRNPDAN